MIEESLEFFMGELIHQGDKGSPFAVDRFALELAEQLEQLHAHQERVAVEELVDVLGHLDILGARQLAQQVERLAAGLAEQGVGRREEQALPLSRVKRGPAATGP